jgi:excisionase family DNA binding protein
VTSTAVPWKNGNGSGRVKVGEFPLVTERANVATGKGRQVLVDIDDVAHWLGTSSRHVRRLVAEKRVPYVKVGHFVRFDPKDIALWIEDQKVAPEESARSGEPIWVKHRFGSVGGQQSIAPRAQSRQASSSSNTSRPWLSNRSG